MPEDGNTSGKSNSQYPGGKEPNNTWHTTDIWTSDRHRDVQQTSAGTLIPM